MSESTRQIEVHLTVLRAMRAEGSMMGVPTELEALDAAIAALSAGEKAPDGVVCAATLDDAAADDALTLDTARELLRDAAQGLRYYVDGEKAEAGGGEAVASLARRVVSHLDDARMDTTLLPGTMRRDLRDLRDELDRTDAGYGSLPASGAVPEGYALVPVEPTAAMVNAAANYDTGSSDGTVGRFCAGEIWYLMLAAAPSLEQEEATRQG